MKNILDRLPPEYVLFKFVMRRLDAYLNQIGVKNKGKIYIIIFKALKEIWSKFIYFVSLKEPNSQALAYFSFLERSLPSYWEKPSIELARSIFQKYKINENFKVDPIIRLSMLMAMHLRNNCENFHRKYLTDDQMKLFNQKIRQGIFEGLVIVTAHKVEVKS